MKAESFHNSAPYILKQERVWNGHFKLDKIQLVFHTIAGLSQEIEREVLFAPDSSAVLLFNPKKHTLILTRQLRVPPFFLEKKTMFTEACAGNIDNEDKENCTTILEAAKITAVREAQEETGWTINKLEFLFSLYSCPGLLTEKIYYFFAEIGEQIHAGGGMADEGEDIDLLEVSLSDAWEMVQNGKIEDAKTIILLQHALLRK